MITAFLVGYLPNKERNPVLIEIKSCEDSINNFDREVFSKDNAEYITNNFKVIKIIDEFCNEYNIAKINIYTKIDYMHIINIKLNELVSCPPYNDKDDCFIRCFLTKNRALSIYPNKNYCISSFYKNSIATFYKNGRTKEYISFDLTDVKNNVKNNLCDFPNNICINLKYGRIYTGEYKNWNDEGKLVIHAIYNSGSIIKDLLEKTIIVTKK
jgi:hypothetical protein